VVDNQWSVQHSRLKTAGGRWKIRVEDKGLKNTIFHPVIYLIIRVINAKRWKMEDRNAFFGFFFKFGDKFSFTHGI